MLFHSNMSLHQGVGKLVSALIACATNVMFSSVNASFINRVASTMILSMVGDALKESGALVGAEPRYSANTLPLPSVTLVKDQDQSRAGASWARGLGRQEILRRKEPTQQSSIFFPYTLQSYEIDFAKNKAILNPSSKRL